MAHDFLDDYVLPEGAAEDLRNAGVHLKALNGDRAVQVMAGHDRGVAFRFVEIAVKNEAASKKAKYLVYDRKELIEWLKSKRSKPVEELRFLPPELLYIDPDTGEATGRYAAAYKRWKEGLTAPGLPLSKWGVLDIADVAALVDAGIFSVEQFAAMPRNRINGRFRPSIVEAFEEAILYTRRQQGLVNSDELARKMVELENRVAQAEARANDAEARAAGKTKAPKRKAPAKKPAKVVKAINEGVRTPGVQSDDNED